MVKPLLVHKHGPCRKYFRTSNNEKQYCPCLLYTSSYEIWCHEQNIAPSSEVVRSSANEKFNAILTQATLQMPEKYYSKKGGKSGLHTENLGFILADMQYLQRSYPGVDW